MLWAKARLEGAKKIILGEVVTQMVFDKAFYGICFVDFLNNSNWM